MDRRCYWSPFLRLHVKLTKHPLVELGLLWTCLTAPRYPLHSFAGTSCFLQQLEKLAGSLWALLQRACSYCPAHLLVIVSLHAYDDWAARVLCPHGMHCPYQVQNPQLVDLAMMVREAF